jgi:hypothetical protein
MRSSHGVAPYASSLARGRAVRMALNQNLSDEAAALARPMAPK